MPAQATAVALNAINAANAANAANVRVAPSASVDQREQFQSLLEIGIESDADKPRSVQNDNDERKEIVAAPLNADVRIENRVNPSREEHDHDAHVRAYRKTEGNRRAESRSEDVSADDRRVETGDGVRVEQPEKIADPQRVESADDSVREEVLSELRDHIAMLDYMLKLFVGLGGNPQELQVKIDSVLFHVSTVTFSSVSMSESGAVDGTLQDGGDPLGDLLKNILAQMEQLSAALQEGRSGSAADAKTSFFSLMRDIRQLALQLNANPEAVTVAAKEKTPLTQAVHELIRQYTQLLKTASVAETQNTNDGVVIKADGAEKITPKQILAELVPQVQNIVRTDSVSVATVAVTASAASYAVPSAGADTQTGTGDQNGNNQSLAQSVSAVRNNGSAPTNQATGPSFAQLMEQTRESVFDQIRFQIKTSDNNSDIKIQLRPEDLGRVDIRMQVGSDGKTGVSVTADNKGTLELLQRDARELARALSDAGLKTDSGSLSFNLRSGQQQNQNQNSSFAQSYKNPLPEEPSVALAPVITRDYVVKMTSGLDVTV